MSLHKINAIQALRGVAITLVVYTHVLKAFFTSRQDQFFHLETWGAIGVDLFFVISGFIMTTILPKYIAERHSASDFLMKRVIRILPLYLLIATIAWFLARHNSNVNHDTYLNTLTILPIFDNDKYNYGFMPQAWSLAYELYFYLLISIFLVISRAATLRNLLIALFSLSLIGCFINSQYLVNLVFSPLLLEFIFGITIGLAYQWVSEHPAVKLRFARLSWLFLIAGALGMLSSIFADTTKISETHIFAKFNSIALLRVIIWGVPSALFLMGLVFVELLNKVRIPSILVIIGDASFSCYLWQYLILSKLTKLTHRYLTINPDIIIPFVVIAILFLSWPAYKYIEQPLMSFLKGPSKAINGMVKGFRRSGTA